MRPSYLQPGSRRRAAALAAARGRRIIYDAVIIGAGPAGSSLAAVLARRGWDVRVLEQRREFGHKVCGEFISWEAQGILRSLGLQAEVERAQPRSLQRAVLTSRTGIAAGFRLNGGSWGLSRKLLDRALAAAARAAGAELSMATRVQHYEPLGGPRSGYGVQARSGGQPVELECRALIVAGGRVGSGNLPPRSRAAAGPKSGVSGRRRHTPRIGIKQHFLNGRMPPQVELYFFDGGYLGLAPIESGLINLCLLTSGDALERAGSDPAALIESLADHLPAIANRLSGAEPVHPAPLAAAPVDLWRTAEPWDALPCVGDAAAMIPPLAGDGIAAALRSVELCAPLAHEYLNGDLTLEQWEQAYRSQWQAALDRPLKLARRLESGLSARVTSDLLLGLGTLIPPLAGKFAQLTRSRKL